MHQAPSALQQHGKDSDLENPEVSSDATQVYSERQD
jgi:hypothetical protein